MNDYDPAVAEAFSRKAKVYDRFGEGHPNLDRMRKAIREQVLHYLNPGAHILEINAGTGGDAAFFAQKGYRVHATEIAPGMLAEIRAKTAVQDLADRLAVQDLSFTRLDRLRPLRFDAIFSNMGGLNCIRDLTLVTRNFPLILEPGATVTLVIMPPFCPWEWFGVFKGDFRTAFRRLGKKKANVEGIEFPVSYFTPREVLGALGEPFSLLRLRSISLFAPPADIKQFALRFPRLYETLVGLDQKITPRRPFNQWGDFFALTAIFLG